MKADNSFVPLTYEAFKKNVQNRKLIECGDCIVAAVSGGCDSSAMFHLLYLLSKDIDFSLVCAHVNHNIRGDEAKRDEDYVRKTSAKYGVPFRLLSADVTGYALKNHLSTEEAGRKIRYDFFAGLSEEFGKIKIATAHTLSDSAETFIFNASRGCSVMGLCGIPSQRDNIIRPIIDYTRDQTEDYCWQNDIDYMTDSTNLGDDYTRNRIRHTVIPVLKDINPGFEKAFSKLENNLSEIRNYIKDQSDLVLSESYDGTGYICSVISRAPSFIQNEAAAEILRRFCFEVTNERVLFLKEAFSSPGDFKKELSKGRYLVKQDNVIRLKTALESSLEIKEVPFREGEICLLPDKTLKVEILDYAEFINSYKVKNINLKQTLDYDKIKGIAFIRSRRTGDSADIHGGTKTLKKLFIEEKIPSEKRNRIAVISDSDGIVWVESLGTNRRCRVTDKTKTVAVIYSSDIFFKKQCGGKYEVQNVR